MSHLYRRLLPAALLENGTNVTHMTSALQQLSSLVGPSLIITLVPQTVDMQSTGSDYFQTGLEFQDYSDHR